MPPVRYDTGRQRTGRCGGRSGVSCRCTGGRSHGDLFHAPYGFGCRQVPGLQRRVLRGLPRLPVRGPQAAVVRHVRPRRLGRPLLPPPVDRFVARTPLAPRPVWPRHDGCVPASRSLWSLWSEQSVLSIASKGSVLSIGSVGSVLSIGSVGSAGSALSVGSFASLGSALSAVSRWSVLSYRRRLGVLAAG